jgi:imidazolonepropionase-like amidohydrolase
MATVNAARLLNLEGKAGTLRTGSFADVIAVDADPRADVEQLQHVRFVMKDGKVYRDEWAPVLALRN